MKLSAVLADLADQAKMYADPDRAIGAARRRRVTRLAASACAVAVVAVLGGVAYLTPPVKRSEVERPAASDQVPPRLRALYPPAVQPQPTALYLRPVADSPGTAAFVYAPCPRGDCWPNLVRPDGKQYRVPPFYEPAGQPWDVTLSPDGRYAGWRNREEVGWYNLVDLRTGANTRVGDPPSQLPVSPWVWSPDSKLLVLAEHRDGDVARYLVRDFNRWHDGERVLPASVAGPDGSVVGIRNNGDLVVWVGDFGGQLPRLRLVDQASRQVRTTLQPPAAGGLLAEGERVLGLLTAACDCMVWFTVFAPGEAGQPTALLGMDLTDGHLTGRIDLPRSAESGGQQPGVWQARASLPGGIALVHHHPGGTDIEILNDVTGERVVVTRIPADAHVVLRGQARY